MESVLDSAARALGLCGAQIRRRNLIRPTDIPYRLPSRLVDDSGHYAACLDKAIELAGFDDQAHRDEQQRRMTGGPAPAGCRLRLLQRADRARPGRVGGAADAIPHWA